MFLRKDTVEEKQPNQYTLKHFCNQCDSIEIEHICKDCGSTDIKYPNLWNEKDMRGHIPSYKTREIMIHKCEACGKEFDKLKAENRIFFSEGDFKNYEPYNDYYKEEPIYTFEKDICSECIQTITSDLNQQIEKIIEKSYVKNTVQNHLGRIFMEE